MSKKGTKKPTFGLTVGIGGFVALYIQIDSLNRLAYGYACRQNGSMM